MKNNSLWQKINSFEFDEQNSHSKFHNKLARENGWTIAYAKRVLEEYLKFIYLTAAYGNVSPSDQIDQAWHLHLTHTRSYWTDLCKNILGKDIHHDPSKGGNVEDMKHKDMYKRTIELYIEEFGLPPFDIWKDPKSKKNYYNFQRVNMHKNIVFENPIHKIKDFFKSKTPVCLLFFLLMSTGMIIVVTLVIILIIVILIAIFSNDDKKKRNGGGCSSGSSCGFFGGGTCSSSSDSGGSSSGFDGGSSDGGGSSCGSSCGGGCGGGGD